MSTSKSNSQTTSSSTNLTSDNRIAADNGAIVLGQGATLTTLDGDLASDALSKMGAVSSAGMGAVVEVAGQNASLAKVAAESATESAATSAAVAKAAMGTVEEVAGGAASLAKAGMDNSLEMAGLSARMARDVNADSLDAVTGAAARAMGTVADVAGLNASLAKSTVDAMAEQGVTNAALARTLNADALGANSAALSAVLGFAGTSLDKSGATVKAAMDAMQESQNASSRLTENLSSIMAKNDNPAAAASESMTQTVGLLALAGLIFFALSK